jgi:DNA-directed RNA polymerase subunit M/transcription elongation factor TFIIS
MKKNCKSCGNVLEMDMRKHSHHWVCPHCSKVNYIKITYVYEPDLFGGAKTKKLVTLSAESQYVK